MDNVTHTLVGVALARAGFRRVTPHATLLLILATNIPDIDILSLSGGQLADFEIHRGYTHTLLALPLMALLCVGLTALVGTEKIPVLKAWAVACVGVASHLLLDWTNSFGIRPLLPFSSRWFYLDLNGLYDGLIITMLILALVWPWFVGLVSSEIGGSKQRGQGSSIAVLLFLLLFEGARWGLHGRALNLLNSRLYGGEVPVQVAALPDPNNPFRWTGVVETADSFRLLQTTSVDISNTGDARVFAKPTKGKMYKALLDYEPFRYMAYFSRFPVWQFDPVTLGAGVGRRVDMTDLRFGTPDQGSFHASALLGPGGQVLESTFGFSTLELRQLSAKGAADASRQGSE
jgi:inner membrane protein